MIHIRRIFPENNYTLRKIKVVENRKTVSKIGQGELTELPAKGQSYIIKLDYHKTQLQAPETEEDLYYILYFDIRNRFPFNYTDMMFKNALRIKKVSKKEFESLSSEELYPSKTGEKLEPEPIKIFSLAALSLVALLFVLSPFLFYKSDANNFAFIIGLLSLAGFTELAVSFRRKTIQQYTIRLIAFGLLSLILLFFTSINFPIKLIAAGLALSILFINISSEMKQFFKRA